MAIGTLLAVPGTRLLMYSTGFLGKKFPDPRYLEREWTVTQEFQPLGVDHLIRLRAVDAAGFVTFVNEMDLDLLRGLEKPGSLHERTGRIYPEIGCVRDGWAGLYMDEEDLEDDLHIRELELRVAQRPFTNFVDAPLAVRYLERYIHTDGRDYRRLEHLVMDADPYTHVGPDYRIETLCKRWACVEKEPIAWTE